jgi:F0F1-type ATP synthase membrane subunit b/b'
MSNAKEEAVRIKAHAHEEAEKQIADARTQAERVLTLSLSL